MDLLILLCVCLAVLAGLRVGQAASRLHAAEQVRGAPMGGARAETGRVADSGMGGRVLPPAQATTGDAAGKGGGGPSAMRQERAQAILPATRRAGTCAPAARGMGDRWWDYLPPAPLETARPL